jgi:hypothetical protein
VYLLIQFQLYYTLGAPRVVPLGRASWQAVCEDSFCVTATSVISTELLRLDLWGLESKQILPCMSSSFSVSWPLCISSACCSGKLVRSTIADYDHLLDAMLVEVSFAVSSIWVVC